MKKAISSVCVKKKWPNLALFIIHKMTSFLIQCCDLSNACGTDHKVTEVQFVGITTGYTLFHWKLKGGD